jgi:hypothetical protein
VNSNKKKIDIQLFRHKNARLFTATVYKYGRIMKEFLKSVKNVKETKFYAQNLARISETNNE